MIPYVTGGDAEGQGTSIDGDVVRISGEEVFKACWSCGSCDGRQIQHLFKITPDNRVDDLGITSLTPELDLVDEVYSDIRDGKPTGDLVSASALALQRSWQPMKGGRNRSLFLSTPSTVEHQGGRALLCFHANYDFDRSMSPILFTIEGNGRHRRIVDAKQDAPHCTPANSPRAVENKLLFGSLARSLSLVINSPDAGAEKALLTATSS